MTLIFGSPRVDLIRLRTASLIDVSLSGTISPRYIVKSKSVASFKHNLRSIDLSSFLNYVSSECEFTLWFHFHVN